MKVLHINCNYIYTKLHQLMIGNLEEKGIDNTVYSPVAYHAEAVIKPQYGEVISECFPLYSRYVYHYKQSLIRNDLENKIKVSDHDIIHAYTVFTDGNVAMQLSQKYNIPYVVAVRDTDVNTFFKKIPFLRKRGLAVLLNARYVFFLSKTYMEYVIEKYVPSTLQKEIVKKSIIIPNGIDEFWLLNKYSMRDYSTIRSALEDFNIKAIFVGAISKRKNVSTTVKALNILKGQGWKISFTVIGKVEDRDEFDSINKSEFSHYLGPKGKEEIMEFLRQNDIFIMPSITETFGLSYAEALSQGLPVIYSRGQGFDGQFEDGQVGYAVNSRSEIEIANRIEKILANYEQISKRCISAADSFNWKIIAGEYDKVYNHCMGIIER